jgi:hypothetical protein
MANFVGQTRKGVEMSMYKASSGPENDAELFLGFGNGCLARKMKGNGREINEGWWFCFVDE